MLKVSTSLLDENELNKLIGTSTRVRLAPAEPKGPVPVTAANAPEFVFNSIAEEGISGQPVVQREALCAKAAVELLKYAYSFKSLDKSKKFQLVVIVIVLLPALVALPGLNALPKLLFQLTEPPLSETVIDCAKETPLSKKNAAVKNVNFRVNRFMSAQNLYHVLRHSEDHFLYAGGHSSINVISYSWRAPTVPRCSRSWHSPPK
jgi:hypothetical protein